MPRGPAPKVNRRRANEPAHDWVTRAEAGWQHGEIPPPPRSRTVGTRGETRSVPLLAASREAWETWFRAWFAAHWGPEDLPGLRQMIRLYDQVERGDFVRHGELRLAMDSYGITKHGQQQRRWKPPVDSREKAAADAGAGVGDEDGGVVIRGKWAVLAD